jgi:hypothetical protein
MLSKRHLLRFALVSLLLVIFVVVFTLRLPGDPAPGADTTAGEPPSASITLPVTNDVGDISAVLPVRRRESPISGSKNTARGPVEVSGRVTDTGEQPIANVLVTEQRDLFSTRSDDTGRYSLMIDLSRQHNPTLLFQRRGFDARRVRLERDRLLRGPTYELDVRLGAALDSVDVNGRVTNEQGLVLEGAWVGLRSRDPSGLVNFYLTTFSDEQGYFVFEGVPAGGRYKLSVKLTPGYRYFADPDFVVSRTPGQVDIVLETLRLADISGMILNRESVPVPDYAIYISNRTSGFQVKKIVSDSSGFFELEDFPLGEVGLSSQGPELVKISGLRLTESDHRNLAIYVDRGYSYLSGWVSDTNGVAVESARVTLESTIRDGAVETYTRRSQTADAGGHFAFANLGGGEYHVSVHAAGYRNQSFDHRFDSQAEELHIRLARS